MKKLLDPDSGIAVSQTGQPARVQFTIRSVMIAVAVIAGLLAMLRLWREFLPILIVVGIPLTGLYKLLAKVPRNRPEWRTWITAAILGYVVLAAGWLWVRAAISFFQPEQGSIAIDGSIGGADYEFWGLTPRARLTGICLAVYASGMAIVCAPRRRRKLLPLVMGYALALAVLSSLLLACLAL